MQKERNKELKKLNTFSISAKADLFIEFETAEDLRDIFSESLGYWRVIGGGSNMLFTKDFNGTLLHPVSRNITIIDENNESAFVKADAGIDWDFFVEYAVSKSLYGIENLSLIPGTVGASPVQNIGAYGVEAKDTIFSVEYFDTEDMSVKTILNRDCRFGYRDSIFKQELSSRAIVLNVTFSLSKIFNPNLSYRGLKDSLQNCGELTAEKIRETVIKIRKSKLPDPKILGNGGSFFKNPVITATQFESLKSEYSNIPFYPAEGGVKIPAAWLIEQSGWKGKRIADAGVHTEQALVLVNHGEATGKEIVDLAEKIISDVNRKFNIKIHPEINIL